MNKLNGKQPDNKWNVFFSEFIRYIEDLGMEKIIDDKDLNFLVSNMNEITSLIEFRKNSLAALGKEICEYVESELANIKLCPFAPEHQHVMRLEIFLENKNSYVMFNFKDKTVSILTYTNKENSPKDVILIDSIFNEHYPDAKLFDEEKNNITRRCIEIYKMDEDTSVEDLRKLSLEAVNCISEIEKLF